MTIKNNAKFTELQSRFIDERVQDPSKTLAQCARDAGYQCSNDEIARAEGSRQNNNPRIAAEIAKRSEKIDVALVMEQTVFTRKTLIDSYQEIIASDDTSNRDKLSALKDLSSIHNLRDKKPRDEALSELEDMTEDEAASRLKELIRSNEKLQDIIKDMITSDRDLAVFFTDMILKDEELVGRLRATIAVEASSLAVAGTGK